MAKTKKVAKDSPTQKKLTGRPPIHKDRWSKVTVIMLDRQVVYLDRLTNDIRAKTGAVVKRAEIIRALVDVLAKSKIDITEATSEDSLRAIISRRLA